MGVGEAAKQDAVDDAETAVTPPMPRAMVMTAILNWAGDFAKPRRA